MKRTTIAGAAARISPWFDLYHHPKGKRRRVKLFSFIPRNTKKGVYLVRSKNTGKVVYVGSSEYQLYKTLLRHFQKWDDKQGEYFEQYRTVFKNDRAYQVQIITTDARNIRKIESHLIQKHDPKYNKIETGPQFRRTKERKRSSNLFSDLLDNFDLF